jgi:hypothetical protein
MKVIYIAHPFGGKPENVQAVEQIILKLINKYPDYVFYSPLHATGFYYHKMSYDKGMEVCIEMLSRCDELWLCGNWKQSKGCNIEHNNALAEMIPIKFLED